MFKQVVLSRRLTRFRPHPRLSVLYSTTESNATKGDSLNEPLGGSGGSGGGGKRRGGSIFLKLLGVTCVGVGGIATVCYLSKDVREQLETSVPYFKDTEDAVLSGLSTTLSVLGLQTEKDRDTKKTELQNAFQKVQDKVKGLYKDLKPEPKVRKASDVGVTSTPPPPLPGVYITKDDPRTKTAKKEDAVKSDLKPEPKVRKSPDVGVTSSPPPPLPSVIITKDEPKTKIAKKEDTAKPAKKEKDPEMEKVDKLVKDKEAEEERQKRKLEYRRKVYLDDIDHRTHSLAESVKAAISAQVNLETKIRQHTVQLKKALDDDGSKEEDHDSLWKAVASAHEAMSKALNDAATAVLSANTDIDSLKMALDETKVDPQIVSNETFANAKKKVIQMEYDLNLATENTQKADAEASSVLMLNDLIEKGKRQFMKEVESVKQYHGRLSHDGKMTEDDWNFLIAHAYRRVEQLQKRIVQLEMEQKQVFQSAVTMQRSSDEKLTEHRLSTELQRQQQEFELEKQKWEAKAREAFDFELEEALARQSNAHSDHLVHVLRIQRDEQNRQFELETRERILRERESFQAAIEKWISRVKGLETAVENRALLERQGQLSHKLWLACQTFADTLFSSEEMEETVPLKERISEVEEASAGDAGLTRLLSEISPVAVERGVFTMGALRHRFRRVKTVCKRVAMVNETGGSLFDYILSWVQSLFILERARIYGPQDELNLEEIDTFTILSNADECIRNGDLETALKFMAQLKGLSRVVADDWINECRLTLEAQLIANALMAFAGDRSARAILKKQP